MTAGREPGRMHGPPPVSRARPVPGGQGNRPAHPVQRRGQPGSPQAGRILAGRVGISVAGHSSHVAAMAGLRLPIESHLLQAFVSEPIKP